MSAPPAPTPSAPPGRVSVIVVSWNSRRFLSDCLRSVAAQTQREIELIVVDNGSSDGSADFVAAQFPGAILIRNASNEGFCRANNAALKRATGVFILCLNADAILEPDFIENALAGFRATHRVGMVSGKILRFDGVTIDSAGQMLTRARRIVDRGYGEKDAPRFDEAREVFSVCGAAALYWRAMIDSVSSDGEFFDESFFAFGEDMDVAWRAQRAGFRAWYQPSARVRHFRGGSQTGKPGLLGRFFQTARRPASIRAHIVKNRWLMILKNDTLRAYLRDFPFIAAWEAAQGLWLLFAAPSTIPHLWRAREAFARAWRRRRPAESGAGA